MIGENLTEYHIETSDGEKETNVPGRMVYPPQYMLYVYSK